MRNKLAQKIKLGAALLLMAGTSAFAQTSNQIYTPTPENIFVSYFPVALTTCRRFSPLLIYK